MPVIEQEEAAGTGVRTGTLVRLLPEDRHAAEVSISLTPGDVHQVITDANGGDQQDQAKLAQEILEKDWDIAQTIQTRAAAVLGTPWKILPANDSAGAHEVAETIDRLLRETLGDTAGLDSFEQFIAQMLTAYLPGFSVSEIVWREGGAGIEGFQHIPQHHFTFRNSLWPLLVTKDQPAGWELPANKFVIHRYRHRCGDIVRGGLIRPLAWLYAFKNLNLKDLLRYLEKFGMPFVAARVDDHAFDKERRKVSQLVRQFGSDGGAVFTKATEIELIAGHNGSAEVYFRFLEYSQDAIAKVVLGQTSTSDSRSSNRSTAAVHNLVRQDLREDDCRAIEATVQEQVIRPLVVFNFGPGALEGGPPKLRFDCEPMQDLELESRILLNLAKAGYRVRKDEVEARFGYQLEDITEAQTQAQEE